jgi:PKD repeat protein
LPLEPAQPWFVDPQTNLNFVAAIDSGHYKGIATSMEFGGLQALPESSLTQLMRTYLEFLGFAQAPVSARFSSDKRSICMNQEVQFSFDGIGDPDSFLWSFEGGQTTSLTSSNPLVTYSSPGIWPVILKVNQGNYSDSVHVQEYIVVNNCSSISESVISKISVYPNPASEFVQLALPEVVSEHAMLSLYDLNGKLIREIAWPKAQQIHGMKIANLKPGVYVLRLKSLQKRYLGKLIVK